MDYKRLALQYQESVHASSASAVNGEPEAQLTIPISNLFIDLAKGLSHGKLSLIRETRLDGTRPDFAAVTSKGDCFRQKGFIEIKEPGTTVNTLLWRGRNARQWDNLSRCADVLMICNGVEAQIYKDGVAFGQTAALPFYKGKEWNHDDLLRLLDTFLSLNPSPIRTTKDLSSKLAVRAASLRDRLLWLLSSNMPGSKACKGALASWRLHIHPDATEHHFADGMTQVVAYGMLLAILTRGKTSKDKNSDNYITITGARNLLRSLSPVMAAAFAPLVEKHELFEATKVEIGALESTINAVDGNRINSSKDPRGEPWLYFYEDFLESYDPEERKKSGVYYTPIQIVKAMANLTQNVLIEKFNRPLGFGDVNVTTLDPATGTGTFPLAVVDIAVNTAKRLRGDAGPVQAVNNISQRLIAFELLPGPYSVAHVRLNQRLQAIAGNETPAAQVLLADTLDSPLNPIDQPSLFGDAEVLSIEQNRAKNLKLKKPVTAIIGNPPYRRVSKDLEGRGSGKWILGGQVPNRKNKSKSLFDDILDVAKSETIFSHHASLYNLYVYFWRWAIWKAFEAHGDAPAIVSYITGSSWLSGPGFVGLRKLARQHCHEIWVLDLGGDNKGAVRDENVFAIESPVAVVILVRLGTKDKSKPAIVRYRRFNGNSVDKIAAMEAIANSGTPFEGNWELINNTWTGSMKPVNIDANWNALPSLTDIFPWQQAGCMIGRTWPIAPHKDLLETRWIELTAASAGDKAALFSESKTGKKVNTSVNGLARIIDEDPSSFMKPILPYGFRSFDRQWIIYDQRLIDLGRPQLWEMVSDKQIYFTSLLTSPTSGGPVLTATPFVPDKHHHRGSAGGKDTIPLYLDKNCKKPNLLKGLIKTLKAQYGLRSITAEDVYSYVFAVLNAPNYRLEYEEFLKKGIPRVPITRSAKLWADAVSIGKEMVWLSTFTERFKDVTAGMDGNLPTVSNLQWLKPVLTPPRTLADVQFDVTGSCLFIGDGILEGISKDVWLYSVSGMQVVKKWIGYRTVTGSGRAASSQSQLDRIRPSRWYDEWNDELMDLVRVLTRITSLHPALNNVLKDIINSEMMLREDIK